MVIDLSVPQRKACPECEVFETTLNSKCWCCGGPLIPGHKFHDPSSIAFLHPMLAHLQQQETSA